MVESVEGGGGEKKEMEWSETGRQRKGREREEKGTILGKKLCGRDE